MEISHFLKLLSTISLVFASSSLALPTNFVSSRCLSSSDLFIQMLIKIVLHMLQSGRLDSLLEGALNWTSRGWTILVQPAGTKIGVFQYSFSNSLTQSVFWALCRYSTWRISSFTYCFQDFTTHCFITSSSYHAWTETAPSLASHT